MKTFDARTAAYYLELGKRVRGVDWPDYACLEGVDETVWYSDRVSTREASVIEVLSYFARAKEWVECTTPSPQPVSREVLKERKRIKARLRKLSLAKLVGDRIERAIDDE